MPCQYETTRTIEFADTDMAGIAHFSRFFVFMEQTEHAFWRSLGLSVHMQHDGQILSWPRLSTSCEYVNPVRFEDEISIAMKVTEKRPRTVTYGFDFSHGDLEVACGELKVACCLCNPGEKMRAIPIPESIASHLEVAPGGGG